MKDLLLFIINSIIENQEVKIEEEEAEGILNLKIIAPSEVVGQIIGKEGKTIKAIQDIVRVKGRLEGKSVFIQVQET